MKKQLPSQNKVSFALDGWTSTITLAITSVIAYYMNRNWGLREVQLAIDEVDRLLFSRFESGLRTIGRGPTYWSKASSTFEGHAWSCWAYWRLFAWNYDWWCLLKLLNDTRAAIDTRVLRNRVACIEEPHTMHGARHTAGFRCIHEQSRCERPHEVLGSPWVWLAIGRQWSHSHCDESKASERRQHKNQYRVGHEIRFHEDNVESTYPRYFESAKTDLHVATIASCIDYTNTSSLEWAH